MPIHQLVKIGHTSGGVVLPKSELRALGLVDEDGVIENHPVRITQTDKGTWKISLINPDKYPDQL